MKIVGMIERMGRYVAMARLARSIDADDAFLIMRREERRKEIRRKGDHLLVA